MKSLALGKCTIIRWPKPHLQSHVPELEAFRWHESHLLSLKSLGLGLLWLLTRTWRFLPSVISRRSQDVGMLSRYRMGGSRSGTAGSTRCAALAGAVVSALPLMLNSTPRLSCCRACRTRQAPTHCTNTLFSVHHVYHLRKRPLFDQGLTWSVTAPSTWHQYSFVCPLVGCRRAEFSEASLLSSNRPSES